MASILDQVAVNRPMPGYRPSNTRDFFVLRLAQKLGESSAAEHYADLAARYSDETLLLAYRRAVKNSRKGPGLAKTFHVELASAKEQISREWTDRLLAIKVERRCVAVAVFMGGNLDFHDRRILAAQPDKADASAIGFLRWVISSFDIESAALEMMTNGDEIRRAALNREILDMLRAGGTPVWELSKREILAAYAHPPLRTRGELRKAVKTILWSMLNSEKTDPQELDAAAVGLYVQTERLFL